jgi:hypothetical protein
MKIIFTYDENKDIECLLKKGPGSHNQPGNRTKTYEELLAFTSEVSNTDKVREFVRKYIFENSIDVQDLRGELQRNWDLIAGEFERRSERIFGIRIADQITAYMTITGRYPYYIEDKAKFFYVPAKRTNANATTMHELLHFYTWFKFGESEPADPQKYNDVKESLTALLNIEFSDLMNGAVDSGYPQHARLREMAADEWKESKDINKVWNALRSSLD